MTQPNPLESRDERRRRLLSATRRAESSIDDALLSYGEGEQARNRERVNQEIEKFLPGVTEDEQSPIGMYLPSAENYPKDYVEYRRGIPSQTHTPMRREIFRNPSLRNTINEGLEPSHPDYIKPWTSQEEEEWSDAYNKMSGGIHIVGTAPGDYPRVHETLFINPEFNQHREIERDSDMFDHGLSHHASESVKAPFGIDRQNVIRWAQKHRKEVKETGLEDTEWKQRFNSLKEDVKRTAENVPLPRPGERFVNAHEQPVPITAASVQWDVGSHLSDLENLWAGHTKPNDVGNQTRSQTRGPRRQVVNRSEVAQRFATFQTGRTSGRNFSAIAGPAITTGRLDDDISHVPEINDTHTVFSYSTPIAWRRRSGEVVMPTQRFSKTTNRHQHEIRRALENQGYHSPQRIAQGMLDTAYRQDAYRTSAGRAIGRRHYQPEHDVEIYYPDAERATEEARAIADRHYERINSLRQQRAAAAATRRSGSRTQRREEAGQLRLPTEGTNG